MNTSDIVGWTPLKPITLGQFNRVRARLIKKGWKVEKFLAKRETCCETCQQDTVVSVILHQQRAEERSFDICFTCGTATEQQPIFASTDNWLEELDRAGEHA